MSGYTAPKSFNDLFARPKGAVDFIKGESFLLHVFFEAPSLSSALESLGGLRLCAIATHGVTPCTSTYFFRVSSNNSDLCPPAPTTVGEHQALRDAKKKLAIGSSVAAIQADMKKRNIPLELIDMPPETELPDNLREKPVALEFTEVYLDERAFMEHAGSREYFDGYAVIMRPGSVNRPPTTIRIGTPTKNVVENILEPVLKEQACPLEPGNFVWRGADTHNHNNASHDSHVFLSLDLKASTTEWKPEEEFASLCSTLVQFAHPLREDVIRVIAVLSKLSLPVLIETLSVLQPIRGEAWVANRSTTAELSVALREAGLEMVNVWDAEGKSEGSHCAGYILHASAMELIGVDKF
jgi:hypothetical protein